MKKEKYTLCGIYKITSPSDKVYIGYSEDIERRFRNYKTYQCSNQPGIYNSLRKYGSKNHIFEILELCDFEDLCKRERYWQDFYDVLKLGLNCVLTETDEKPRIYKEGYSVGEKNPYYGKKHTEEILQKMSDAHKRRSPESYKRTPEQRLKLIGRQKGKIISKEARKKMSLARLGKKLPEERVERMREESIFKKGIEQYDLEGNLIKKYSSIAEASRETGTSNSSITMVLSGINKKANGFIWKYQEGFKKEPYCRVTPKNVFFYLRDSGEFFKKFLSVHEAAEFLGIKSASVRNFLTGHRVNKDYIISYKKVNNIITDDN